MTHSLRLLSAVALLPIVTYAAEPPAVSAEPAAAKAPAAPQIQPTLANVPYGSDPKQVLDFYKAPGDGTKPLMFFIHGGGWTAGEKSKVSGLAEVLAAGISVVSVEYRFTTQAQAAGIKPPVSWPMHDCARALQFVRSKAAEWGINKERIGASGGSAGACTSLWLAFHPDLADPKSKDPIARESTRLDCAAVIVAQTSLDPHQMREWTPNSRYGGHAFGFLGDKAANLSAFDQFYAGREQVIDWIREYSPYELATPDDAPIYMVYRTAPALGKEEKDPTHTANFGVKLAEKLKSIGVACELSYPGATDSKHASAHAYLIERLKR
jgi:acetyl esterase/lipase